MRKALLLTLVFILSLFVFCSKKDSSVTGPTGTTPDDGGETVATAFKLVKHAIYADLPNSVVFLFQVTDLENRGVDFLTADRFQIFEEDKLLDPTAASAYLLKANDVDYVAKTRVIIDNNVGTNLDALKKGAVEFINKADPKEEIAIYTMSDKLEKIQDFSSDPAMLAAAVNGITEGAAEANVYGSIMEVNREDKEEYTLGHVQQNMVVIFTDSPDDVNAYPIEVVSVANRTRKIYTVGYGGVDKTELEQIGAKAYYAAADEAGILQAAAQVQKDLISYMNSFYRLVYRSTLRGGTGHTLSLKISGNLNTGDGAELIGTFDSTSFVDVEDGLYVNWSYAAPEGVSVVLVMVDGQATIHVLSMGGAKIPIFTFSVADDNVVSVAGGSGGMATISAKGADGDSTLLTIKDTANGLTKAITVKVVSFQMGAVLFEKWDNVNGTAVSDLTKDPRYPANPSSVEQLTSWEIPKDVGDNYGTRVRGYLHPPQTGKYTFWISSDDASELLLSTDESPDNAVKICYVSSWTNSREWTKETNQKSIAIELEAGKAYYMESLHKEGGGGDNCAVAWAAEGASKEVITGDFLSLWLGN